MLQQCKKCLFRINGFAAWRLLFLALYVLKTTTAHGAVESPAPAAALFQAPFGAVPQSATNSDASKRLEEALERKLQGTNIVRQGANAQALPTQLILAPGPAPEPATTNTLEKALDRRLEDIAAVERRAQLLPGSLTNLLVSTNGPNFEVKGFELIGNTLLPPEIPTLVLQPYIGSNANFGTIRQALTDLQKVYSDRGFGTVLVSLPQQTLSNGIVKVRVLEGTIAEIRVVNNHFYSSNNVMRSLPSLHTNLILNSYLFQAELDRANANQDRQIYPQIEPGVEPGTSDIRLQVKDRIPLHAKIELNDQNTPGTPDLRLNSSAVYGNLWQLEHSIGVQYSFSPEDYKSGNQWASYDAPLIANYSGFYRLPLGNPESVAQSVANNVGNFGYSEATRHFNLPPPTGQPELNVYASRSTIDTGVEELLNQVIVNTNANFLRRQDYQQELTENNDLGARLTMPLWANGGFRSTVSGGLDYKTYKLSSYKTNVFTSQNIEAINEGGVIQYITNKSVDVSMVPTTIRPLDYVPLALRFDASVPDALGTTSFGLGLSGNAWYSGSKSNLHGVTGSTRSSGHWAIVNPSLSRDLVFRTNWTLSWRIDAQVASEPLPSNEQFGAGGVASVRGYHEGEVFGDDGWHTSLELKTPGHLVGFVGGKQACTIRASLYMDYAKVFLLDPQNPAPSSNPQGTPSGNGQGHPSGISLWSAGFGAVASVGSRWEARFLFSVPFDATGTTPANELRFNFAISAQF